MSSSQTPSLLSLASVSGTLAFHEVAARLVTSIAEVQPHADISEVLDLLRQERVHGLLIDARLPENQTTALTETFLATQPTGRAILLASDHGTSTLRRLCTRDPRVALFFTPWNRQEVAESLLGKGVPVSVI